MELRRIFVQLAALAVLVWADQPDFSVTTSNLSSWNQSDWSLTALKYVPGHFQSQLAVANGYVGASVAAAGPFFEAVYNDTSGWPLFDERVTFSTISGFYNVQQNSSGVNYAWLEQYGWDSFISGIPHPTDIVFSFGTNDDVYLNANASNSTISNYAQKLSMKTGVVDWSYTWKPENLSTSFNVSYTVFFSRQRPNVLAVKATIEPSEDVNGTVTDLLDGRSAMRTWFADKGHTENNTSIYSSVHPSNLPNVTAWVVSMADFAGTYAGLASGPYVSTNESTIGQSFNVSLQAGQASTFVKYVGVASTDKFANAESVARQAASSAKAAGWDTLLAEHTKVWGQLMTETAVDNYTDPTTGQLPDDEEVKILQIASVANTYYLLQNLQPDGSGLNDNSISVGGLASDSYAGQVFWDADTWMAPGLNLAFPDWAKQIPNFRVKLHRQALENAAFNGYPNGSSLYSWTTGRYGNCTATGPCVDYEYHLNYDLSFNMLQLRNITQNQTWFSNGPEQVIFSTAMMTGQLLQFNKTTGTYWLHNATDPDEYANNIDNPSFTITSAAELLAVANQILLDQGSPVNETWANQSKMIEFPRAASNITLEYQGMNDTVLVKQADVVLMTYPLDYDRNYTTEDKLLDLDYYSVKQSPNGPAMTFGVYAAVANAISPSGCAAYTYTLKALLPYLRAPWYQLSEQQVDDVTLNGDTHPAFPFLTGHGGANQIAPFAFLGIRTDQDVLFIYPSLPPQIPNLRVRTFYYAGASFSAVMNQTHTSLTRQPPAELLNNTYALNVMPFTVGTPDNITSQTTYTIGVNQTVVVPNNLYWQNMSYTGNVLQCLPVSSDDEYVAGQMPNGINDGAIATSWQPSSNSSSSITINTTSVTTQKISGFYFDFGERPAANVSILLWNGTESSDSNAKSFVFDGLKANANTTTSLDVVPVTDNTTTMALSGEQPETWLGDWVRLTIEGCVGCDESVSGGATVAEFVIY